MPNVHYRTMDPKQKGLYLDFKYPHNCYKKTCYKNTVRSPCSETCRNRSYFGNYSNWMTESDLSKNNNEIYREGRGDPPFPDVTVQMGRIANARAYETARHRDLTPATAISSEKMQIRLKSLEESNAMMYFRNQNISAENKGLVRRLEEDAIKIDKLEGNMLFLQDELNSERAKLTEILTKQTKNDEISVEDKYISSTDFFSKTDQEIQVWESCKDCQKELEECQKKPATVTITKSELELLEKDMQTLRDAVVAREEAWDKAMEREQNCRHQLARLTAEAITARHFCEARQNELHMITETLREKESEVKAMQKEALYLYKLIAKLYRHQKEIETNIGDNVRFIISDKDQKYIEEIAQRIRSVKGKSRMKSNKILDKYSYSNSSSCHASPRDNKNIYIKDQVDTSEKVRN